MKKHMLSLVAACAASVGVCGYVQEWRGLPSGYTQVEYIESTGSQYIDTGIMPGTSTAVDFTFNIVTYESGKAFFGQGWSSSRYLLNQQSSQIQFHGDGSLSGDLASPYCNVIEGNDYRCTIEPTTSNNGTLTLTWGGVTRSCTVKLSTEANKQMRIFGSTDSGHFSKIKVYGMKIWQGGELVADLVPAIDGEGKGGLYNLIGEGSNWLANGGTDAFKVGAAVPDPAPDGFTPILTATGARRIYRLGAYEIYEWTDTGDGNGFTVPEGGVIADVLLVGGGGAGGMTRGGGGGGGGVVLANGQELAAGAYTVTVGAGGVPQYSTDAYLSKDWNDKTYTQGLTPDTASGGSSSVSNGNDVELVALGGGGGGSFNYNNNDQVNSAGLAGGSGGGAGGHNEKSISGGTGTEGQGYAGADNVSSCNGGGGGGGAGETGGLPTASRAGNGGAGRVVDITGEQISYGGGGGGGAFTVPGGLGGDGGGGDGNYDKHGPLLAQNGVDGLGGGGGGGGAKNNNGWYGVGGVGGSGTVIVRVLLQGMIGLALSTDNSNACELGVTAMVNASDSSSADIFDVYAAIGADADHLGDFVKIGEDAALNEDCTTVFGGLDANTEYCLAVKAQNRNSSKWSEVLTAKAKTSSLAYPVTAVGPGIVKTATGYDVSLVVSRIQDDVTDLTATLNGEVKAISAVGTYTWQVPAVGGGCSASIDLAYKTLGFDFGQNFSASVSGEASIIALNDVTEHVTAKTGIFLRIGDKVLLPPVTGRGSYTLLNRRFASLDKDKSEITACEAGIVGVVCVDAGGTSLGILCLYVLPEGANPSRVFVFNGNGENWTTAGAWQMMDGTAATEYPHLADDIAYISQTKGIWFGWGSDIAIGQLYVGCHQDSAFNVVLRASNSKTMTLSRTDGIAARIQACPNNQSGTWTLQIGDQKTCFSCLSDVVIDEGWDNAGETSADYGRCVMLLKFNNATFDIPEGRRLTLTGGSPRSFGSSWDGTDVQFGGSNYLTGKGTLVHDGRGIMTCWFKCDGFSGEFIEASGPHSGGYDRARNFKLMNATVGSVQMTVAGFAARTDADNINAAKSTGYYGSGVNGYGSAGEVANRLPGRGLVLCGSYGQFDPESNGWGEGKVQSNYTARLTVDRAFNYIAVGGKSKNDANCPTNVFSAAAINTRTGRKGTLYLRESNCEKGAAADYRSAILLPSFYAGDSPIGGTGDSMTEETYAIRPEVISRYDSWWNPSFAAVDAAGQMRRPYRVDRALSATTDPLVNAYSNDKSIALTDDVTVNSLTVKNGGKTQNLGADRTLTITSGGLILCNDNSAIGALGANGAAGNLVFGDTAYVWPTAYKESAPNTIAAKMTAPKGFVMAMPGYLQIVGDQTGIGDEIVVNGGNLYLGAINGSEGVQISAPVRICAGGYVKVKTANVLRDQSVYFDDANGRKGALVIDAGTTELCNKLYCRDSILGDDIWVSLPRGTYGAVGSGAQFESEYIAAGSGVLTVRKDDITRGLKLILR